MAFATQEDVFAVAEEVLYETFKKFSNKEVSKPPFARIPYAESMLKYGTDKPDLRNPLVIVEISDMFEGNRLCSVPQKDSSFNQCSERCRSVKEMVQEDGGVRSFNRYEGSWLC